MMQSFKYSAIGIIIIVYGLRIIQKGNLHNLFIFRCHMRSERTPLTPVDRFQAPLLEEDKQKSLLGLMQGKGLTM